MNMEGFGGGVLVKGGLSCSSTARRWLSVFCDSAALQRSDGCLPESPPGGEDRSSLRSDLVYLFMRQTVVNILHPSVK